MLGSALPAAATIHTSTSSATPTSPTRPSRLRGLSYLRNYTHNHLHSRTTSGGDTQLTRSTSLPGAESQSASLPPPIPFTGEGTVTTTITGGADGWLPTVQGRSGLSRESLHPTSSTHSASPEQSNAGMTRSHAASAMGPTPAVSSSRAVLRRPTPTEGMNPTTDMTEDNTHLRVTNPALAISNADSNAPAAAPMKNSMPTIRFIPHTESRSNRPSLHFTALTRTLSAHNSIVRVGRYSERDTHTHASPSSPASTSVTPVGFKSKVVSRRHCEFWCSNGQWFVKDVKSSSGTFLNHVRLSQPGSESRPYPVNDGDVVQLGIDFKGGEEVIFRCVKIRIECNRGWQKSLNSFNTSAHKRLLKHTGRPPALRRRGTRTPRARIPVSVASASTRWHPVRRCSWRHAVMSGTISA